MGSCNTGWGKSRFRGVPMENNTALNNTRICSVLHLLTTVNLRFADPVCSLLHLALSTLHNALEIHPRSCTDQ